jgi:hypothetical protein
MRNSSFVLWTKISKRTPGKWSRKASCHQKPARFRGTRLTHAHRSSSLTTSAGGWSLLRGCAISYNFSSGMSPLTAPSVTSLLTAHGLGMKPSSRTSK